MEIHRNSEFTAMPNSPQFRIPRNSEFLAIPRYLEFLVNSDEFPLLSQQIQPAKLQHNSGMLPLHLIRSSSTPGGGRTRRRRQTIADERAAGKPGNHNEFIVVSYYSIDDRLLINKNTRFQRRIRPWHQQMAV